MTGFRERVARGVRRYVGRKHVRPWSLAAPVLVLLVCLPLVQPLLRPWRVLSEEESSRYATVQALVEHRTFAIDETQFKSTHMRTRGLDLTYSNQPPTQALLLAGPYWVLYHSGIRFKDNPLLVQYLLTVIGVTLPVALAAGMIYRIGRLFELKRPWRTGLAVVSVFGSGLVSYATVLNPYAASTSLVLASVALLVRATLAPSPGPSGGYVIAAGFFVALATAVYPGAGIFLLLLPVVIVSQRWRPSDRLAGLLLYVIGLLPPVLLHLSLSVPITGDWKLGLVQAKPIQLASPVTSGLPPPRDPAPIDEDPFVPTPTGWQTFWSYTARTAAALVGSHGLLSHFPVLLVGLLGLASVLHRHWPASTKSLAVVTLLAAAVVLGRYILIPVDWRLGMFAIRWFVIFSPLVVAWTGVWCRRSHTPLVWGVAGGLAVFSVVIGVIGALNPMPQGGYDRWTPVGVFQQLRSY